MRTTFVPLGPQTEASPLMDLNTTPLIDVLLVLLVMLIITIPVQSHSLKLDLPQPPPDIRIDRLHDDIVISRSGELQWNGQSLSREQLRGVLANVGQMSAPPEVHIRPDPNARYAIVDDVLGMARRAHVQALGFVGNERYSEF